jgi:hypothetical protein
MEPQHLPGFLQSDICIVKRDPVEIVEFVEKGWMLGATELSGE